MTRAFVFLLVLLLSQAANAQQLGRLFFTDDQRAALDARRRARVPDKPSAAAPVVASPATRLDGFVRRSQGPSTVWVNGEQLPENVPPGEHSVRVPVGDGGARVELKPGQVLDRATGEVRDVIDGEIRIRRGR